MPRKPKVTNSFRVQLDQIRNDLSEFRNSVNDLNKKSAELKARVADLRQLKENLKQQRGGFDGREPGSKEDGQIFSVDKTPQFR